MSRITTAVAIGLIAFSTGCQKTPLVSGIDTQPAGIVAFEENPPAVHKLTDSQKAEVLARLHKAFPAEAISDVKLTAYKRRGLNLRGRYYVEFDLKLKTAGGTERISGMYTPGKESLSRSLTKAQTAELEALVKKTYSDEQRHSHLTWGEDLGGKLFGHAQVTLWTGPRTTRNVYLAYDFQTKKLTEKPADK